MKKLFSKLPKKALFIAATFAVFIGCGVAVYAGFGPDRPTYTMAKPADHITFNSIIDNPVVGGDERTFLKGALPGAADYSDPVKGVQNDQEVTLLMYVHNDAAVNLNLKAKNTKVKVQLPQGSKQSQTVTGYINADNAAPKEVFDTLNISGNSNFELEYVPGSAKLTNNYFKNGIKLSDSIVTTGALVGYDQLNGVVPGCIEFSGWVTLKLKVNMPSYQITKTARLLGESSSDWRESVSAKIGDTVEWRVEVKNTGNVTLEHVIVLDQLPANTEVVHGSVKLINANHPVSNPWVYTDNAIQHNNGKTWINVDAGAYPTGTNFFVRFNTKIVDSNSLNCGETQLKNIAWATPQGLSTISSYANLSIRKICENRPVYSCDNLKIASIGDRKIEAEVTYTAQNGAVFKDVNFNFGDGSQPLITDKTTTQYTYAKDGTYTIKAMVGFMVDGKHVTANGAQCTKTVTFEKGQPTPTPTVPGELPNTGAGSVAGIFAGATMLGAISYRFWVLRRR